MTRTALYRHWRGEELLYIGISSRITSRVRAHEDLSHWFSSVDTITIEWFPTRELALQAEKSAIRSEAPLHNKVHNGGGASTTNRPTRSPEEEAVWEALSDGLEHRISDITALLGDNSIRMRTRVRREISQLVEAGSLVAIGAPANRTYSLPPPRRSPESRRASAPVPDGAEYLSIAQVQTLSGYSQEAVALALRKGELRGYRPKGRGRWSVRRADVTSWLEHECFSPLN